MSKTTQGLHPVTLNMVLDANAAIENHVQTTPCTRNRWLSELHDADIYLKREDLMEPVHSFKLRGALNKILRLSKRKTLNGCCTASAGNHAQGFAVACKWLKVKGVVFMALTVPEQKVERVAALGNSWVEIVRFGDNFDQAAARSREYAKEHKLAYVHPFDDQHVIAGQGTVAVEFLNECQKPIDFVLGPVGGGGLMTGVGVVMKARSPNTRVIGVESLGSEGMTASRKEGKVITLPEVDPFVDGTAVKTVGRMTFKLGLKVIDEMLVVQSGRVAQEMYNLRRRESIYVEPAGALAIAALDQIASDIKGKTVVCIVSGGNHDSARDEEVRQKILDYQGLTHHLIVTMPERPGALREFVGACNPSDDVINLRYKEEHSHETAHLFVGLRFASKENHAKFLARLQELSMPYKEIGRDNPLFRYFV